MSRKDIDRKTTAAIEKTEVKLQKFMRDLDRAIGLSIDEILSEIRAGKVAPSEAMARLGSFYEKLLQSDFGRQIKKVNALYAAKLRDAAIELRAISPEAAISDVDVRFAETLVDLDYSIIENKIRSTADSMRSAVARQVLGSKPIEARQIRDKYGPELGRQIEIELRTGLSSFHQTLINKKADEHGLNLFIYIGPLDEVTRPLCRHILETKQVWTDAERRELNSWADNKGNTPALPVETYGGGYNCRHQWSPVDPDDAREMYDYKG